MKSMAKQKASRLISLFPWLLVVLGSIGFLFSFIITVEKITVLKNPAYVAPCTISPIISCNSVMKSPQAEVFGFSNPLIGIAGFAIVVTSGMALLAGAQLKRWFWIGLQIGTLFGIGFIHWLFYQSVYVIGALCPFCMVVWAVTIPIFLYTTIYNLREGHIVVPNELKGVANIVQTYHLSILYLWYIAILAAITIHFWYYWSSFL